MLNLNLNFASDYSIAYSQTLEKPRKFRIFFVFFLYFKNYGFYELTTLYQIKIYKIYKKWRFLTLKFELLVLELQHLKKRYFFDLPNKGKKSHLKF